MHCSRSITTAVRWTALLLAAGLLVAFGSAAPNAAADAAGDYRVLNLGTLGGAASRAYGLNESGQVVGEAQDANGHWRAFLWENGGMRDLGTLGGTESAAYAINDVGQVVGKAATGQLTPAGEPIFHAVLWENGMVRDLGSLGGLGSTAYDINNLGQVVGQARNGDGKLRAFRWAAGAMEDLGALAGGESAAYAINDQGQIAGTSDTGRTSRITGSRVWSVCLWHAGVVTDLDAGRNEDTYYYGSAAEDIDSSGLAVGWRLREAAVSSARFATSWRAGETGTELPTDFGGTHYAELAHASNGAGLVTGFRQIGFSDAPRVARYWSGTAAARPLNELVAPTGWVLSEGRAVSGRGEFAGIADSQGTPRAFLLSPVSVRPAGTADLTCTLSHVSVTSADRVREFRATLEVRNGGAGPAPATTARWYVSEDAALFRHDNAGGEYSPNDTLIGETAVPALAPSETFQAQVTLTAPANLFVERNHLLAEADATHLASEANEANNTAAAGEVQALELLEVTPEAVRGGRSATGRVWLSGTPLEDTVVRLASSSRSARVPRKVMVAAGARSATFTIRTQRVKRTSRARITARLGSSEAETRLTITRR